jgi:hypothetical protein
MQAITQADFLASHEWPGHQKGEKFGKDDRHDHDGRRPRTKYENSQRGGEQNDRKPQRHEPPYYARHVIDLWIIQGFGEPHLEPAIVNRLPRFA